MKSEYDSSKFNEIWQSGDQWEQWTRHDPRQALKQHTAHFTRLVTSQERCKIPKVASRVEFMLEVRSWKEFAIWDADDAVEVVSSDQAAGRAASDCEASDQADGRAVARAKSKSKPNRRNQAACIGDGSSRTDPTQPCPCTCSRMLDS